MTITGTNRKVMHISVKITVVGFTGSTHAFSKHVLNLFTVRPFGTDHKLVLTLTRNCSAFRHVEPIFSSAKEQITFHLKPNSVLQVTYTFLSRHRDLVKRDYLGNTFNSSACHFSYRCKNR